MYATMTIFASPKIRKMNQSMRKITSMLICALMALTFVSCNDNDDPEDIIWDIMGVAIPIDVQNTAGKSLLSPRADGTVWGQPMTLVYEGKEYPMEWTENWMPSTPTRAYLAQFYGIFIRQIYDVDTENFTQTPTDRWIIYIGEFQGDMSYEKEMEVKFQGETHKIKLVHKCDLNGSKPKLSTEVYLNGKKLEKAPLVLTAKPE